MPFNGLLEINHSVNMVAIGIEIITTENMLLEHFMLDIFGSELY